ncbi:branched-chain amino acid ABC transporter permease [Nocardioides hungaricus]
MPSVSSPPLPSAPAVAGSSGFDRALRGVRAVLLTAVVLLVVAFPSLAPDAFILSVGVTIAMYAAFSVGWNFVGGFTGYISLGHAAYTGLGGYGTALLVMKADLNPWVAWVVAALAVAVIAVPIGVASLRVRGASFVIVSIAVVLILLLVSQSWSQVTGGSNGLRVPRPFGPDVLRPEQHERFFYITCVLVAVMLLTWWAIDRSRFGTGLKAIREDEDKAQALGVPTFAYKLAVFVISAFYTALAGGLYALWFGFLDPIFQFSILLGAYLVLMSLLGGIRSLFGPVVGAVIVGYALEYFKANFGDTQIHLVALGLMLALVVLFMPDGVLPALGALVERLRPGSRTSIREESASDLLERNRRIDQGRGDGPADPPDGAARVEEVAR